MISTTKVAEDSHVSRRGRGISIPSFILRAGHPERRGCFAKHYPPPLGSGLRRQLGSGMPLGWVKLPLGSGMTCKLSIGSALFGSTAYIGSAH